MAAAASRISTPVVLSYHRMRGVRIGCDTSFAGLPVFTSLRRGPIELGRRTRLVSNRLLAEIGAPTPCIFRCMNESARIVVGDDCGFTGLVTSSRNRITIGDRVLCGPRVVIIDSDGHPLAAVGRRYAPAPEPRRDHDITIGDDVFIGARSLVLKGTTIGSGSVIGAGSAVTRSIPAGVVAAGSPARIVGRAPGSGAPTSSTGA